jgi:hypothetical protein
MKILFFLLLIFNVALAAFIQFKSDSTPSLHVQLPSELHPEKIKSAPASITCLQWGNFIETNLQPVEAALAREQLDDKVKRQAVGRIPVFWVHMPPLSSKFHMERKMGELRNLGVTDFTPVQDNSKWNNAISLGFFPKVEDAQAFLASLRSKGVRSAIIGARNLEQVKFVIIDPPPSVIEKMTELKQEFPASELKSEPCQSSDEGL